MAITECRGDIMATEMHTIICTTNCVGTMGLGIARTVRSRFPDVFRAYRRYYLEGELAIDRMFMEEVNADRAILLFPTKINWRNNSKVEWIEHNLQQLRDTYDQLEIRSMAVPPLGCGHGGLDYDNQIKPLLYRYLEDLDIPVEIYVKD